jgi:signal peptidase I
MTSRRWPSTLLFIVVAAAAWWFLAPTQLGGKDSYAITSGVSMIPVYHAGDLVILRDAKDYKVGDIAGYHDAALGKVVLHRIHAIDNGRYTFKGDYNKTPDAVPVTSSAIVGKAWLHVPHGGAVMTWIRTPIHAALLMAIALLLTGGGLGALRLGRDRAPAAEKPSAAPQPGGERFALPTAVKPEYVLSGVVAVTALFAFVTLNAFTHAQSRVVPVDDYVTQKSVFSYSATAKRGPVYRTGKVASGETVFTLLTGPLHVAFRYDVSSRYAPVASSGTEELLMHVEGNNLWHTDAVLVAPRRFSGSTSTLATSLHLDRLAALIARVERETGFAASAPYRITLTARFTQDGRVGTQPLHDTFSPAVVLDFDKARAFPESAQTSGGDTSASTSDFVKTQTGSGTKTVPSTVNLKLATLTVPGARRVGIGGTLLGAAGVLFLLLARRRQREADEPTRIRAQYGNWLVPVTHMAAPTAPLADVASFEALIALADRADRAVMEYANEGVHTYFVKEDDAVYRYVAHADKPSPAAPAPAEAPEPEAPATDDAPLAHEGLSALPPLEAETWTPSFTDGALGEPAPIVPVEELPQFAPLVQLPTPFPASLPPLAPASAPAPVPAAPTPAAPVSVPAPAAAAPAPAAAQSAPALSAFVPESPETSYQPAPVATPAPIVVPQHATPASPPATHAPAARAVAGNGIVPIAPAAPLPVDAPDVGLIRDTFLRPRPRTDDSASS